MMIESTAPGDDFSPSSIEKLQRTAERRLLTDLLEESRRLQEHERHMIDRVIKEIRKFG